MVIQLVLNLVQKHHVSMKTIINNIEVTFCIYKESKENPSKHCIVWSKEKNLKKIIPTQAPPIINQYGTKDN